MSGDVVIRTATEADLAAILSVESACNSVTWTPDGFARELSDENSLGLIASSKDGTACAFVLSRCAADECSIHTIAVLPSCQRRGIGTQLVQALLLQAARRHCASVFLEVRGRNAGGRAFYAALGFAPCGTRKAYFSDDNDDAIVMNRSITSK
jgi:ribosomal-protein-alanine N-acetyltransferase